MLVTHKLVEEHGGRIEVETAFGQGTTVRVWLPYRTVEQKA
jgi:signal transduction histidine kinase